MLKFTERYEFQIFMYNLEDIYIYNMYYKYGQEAFLVTVS